jgi:hypothetical protein
MHPSQVTKLINANVRLAASFAALIFLYFPADIWRSLTTPFDEIARIEAAASAHIGSKIGSSRFIAKILQKNL